MTLVELCAGTAALSLRLHARNARPPVARMGAKTGYADAILALAGLTPGQRADRYVWAEADPVARAVLAMYAGTEALEQARHELAGWLSEDPGALFARLKDAALSPASAAYLSQAAYRRGVPDSGYDDEVARGRRSAVDVLLVTLQAWSRGHAPMAATIHPSAFDVPVTPGAVVYIDPPYVGTTGYGHALPRSDVVALARLHAAESLVMVSEAEPVAELVADGWHAVDITSARIGQRRTFSKQQAEWVTMSRAPVRVPSEQPGLW